MGLPIFQIPLDIMARPNNIQADEPKANFLPDSIQSPAAKTRNAVPAPIAAISRQKRGAPGSKVNSLPCWESAEYPGASAPPIPVQTKNHHTGTKPARSKMRLPLLSGSALSGCCLLY